MTVNGSFGRWLRRRRKVLDLTQAELAGQVGCATITIRKIEAGARRPSKQVSWRLADVLALVPEERIAIVSFARQSRLAWSGPSGLNSQNVPNVASGLSDEHRPWPTIPHSTLTYLSE